MPDDLRPMFAPAKVDLEHRPDGTLVLRSPCPLLPYPRHLCERLRHFASTAADRVFLAQRAPDQGWHQLRYGEARDRVDRLAQGLLDRGLSAERPLLILSENSIDQALLTLAAMQVGVPVAPISPAYSLISQDLAKLAAIFAVLRPGLVYAADTQRYGRALSALGLPREQVLCSRVADEAAAVLFSDLLQAAPGSEVERRYQALPPDAVAKVLFTSGSTGEPKGVVNTQTMMCSNQQAIAQLWPFLSERPQVVLDWLPWSHTFGGNHNFNLVLYHGGTLYIDEGRPTADGIAATVRNLREVSPTIYFNVPRGYGELLPALEADAGLRHSFFRQLRMLFYAAASLPQPLWERLEAASLLATGTRVCLLSAWGATETAPMVTTVHFPIERAGVIGLPAPGTSVKLVPQEGKLELRVRGPCVTPGYFHRPDLSAHSFDDEGFLRTGDAGKLRDPADPGKGIVFDGRIAEDFKLCSGTWVHVGALRTEVLARMAELVQDAVVTGHDRDEVGLLLFLKPNPGPKIRSILIAALRGWNRDNPGNSRRIARALCLKEPPSIDAGEITDKGYINQRAVLLRRAQLVTALYDRTFDEQLLIVPDAQEVN